MLIMKAYKFRMYPNESQKEQINKTLGCNRLIYNHYLNQKQMEYEQTKKSKTVYECIKDLTNLNKEYPFLKEIDSMSLRCTLFDLDNAFKKMYQQKSNYPRYKNKYSKNSYRTNYLTSEYKGKKYKNIKLDLINRTITLPKLKEIKIKGYRNTKEINGRIINTTITKEVNKYYVSVLVEEINRYYKESTNRIIGLDLGIKNLITTSDYEKIDNEKVLKKYENRIKMLQRRLSRKKKGSNNYYKVKEKLSRIYQKIKNARKYILHKISKQLTEENDIIVSEKLNIKNMVQESKIAKNILDCSFYELTRQLEYKSKWKDKKYIQIDTYYASSQICHVCGYKNKEVKKLAIRNWTCPKCLEEHDRDYNAAENIMYEGLKKYIESIV